LKLADLTRVRRLETTSPEAFRHYSFGRHYLENRSLERMFHAEREFREALKLDPQYARAYAALALTLTHMVWLGGREGVDVYGPAKEAALKAIAIDDSVALSHTVLADIRHYFEYDPVRAQREHLRAIELDDQDVAVLRGYSNFLLNMEAVDEAFEVHQRSLELDPASPFSNRITAQMLYLARRYDECVAECRKVETLDPEGHSRVYDWLGRCLEKQGKQPERGEAWEKHFASQGNVEFARRLRGVFAARGWKAYWGERRRMANRRATGMGEAIALARLGR